MVVHEQKKLYKSYYWQKCLKNYTIDDYQFNEEVHMRKIIFPIKFLLLALIFSFNSLANEITAIKAAENMKNGLIVIDVRNKEEWK